MDIEDDDGMDVVLYSIDTLQLFLLVFVFIYYAATWGKFARSVGLKKTDIYTNMTFTFLGVSVLLRVCSQGLRVKDLIYHLTNDDDEWEWYREWFAEHNGFLKYLHDLAATTSTNFRNTALAFNVARWYIINNSATSRQNPTSFNKVVNVTLILFTCAQLIISVVYGFIIE